LAAQRERIGAVSPFSPDQVGPIEALRQDVGFKRADSPPFQITLKMLPHILVCFPYRSGQSLYNGIANQGLTEPFILQAKTGLFGIAK
jgi:hypothetical protein